MSIALNVQSKSCEGYINCVHLYEKMTNSKLDSKIINESITPETSERIYINQSNKNRFNYHLERTKTMIQNAKTRSTFRKEEDSNLEKIKEVNGSCIMYSLKFSPPACKIVLARPRL